MNNTVSSLTFKSMHLSKNLYLELADKRGSDFKIDYFLSVFESLLPSCQQITSLVQLQFICILNFLYHNQKITVFWNRNICVVFIKRFWYYNNQKTQNLSMVNRLSGQDFCHLCLMSSYLSDPRERYKWKYKLTDSCVRYWTSES